MDIPVLAVGLWNRGRPEPSEDSKRRERCERDTRIDRETQEFHTEGHRPCSCPDKYRKLTPEERAELEKKYNDL